MSSWRTIPALDKRELTIRIEPGSDETHDYIVILHKDNPNVKLPNVKLKSEPCVPCLEISASVMAHDACGIDLKKEQIAIARKAWAKTTGYPACGVGGLVG